MGGLPWEYMKERVDNVEAHLKAAPVPGIVLNADPFAKHKQPPNIGSVSIPETSEQSEVLIFVIIAVVNTP